ncbi:MAG: carbohydrate-binding domain-containing protein [Clostridia bacterium]|nr:carbohydrate-binding domain-containing protein [Clostridia bacterium]
MRNISRILSILAIISLLIWLLVALAMFQKSEKNNEESNSYVTESNSTTVEYTSDELLGEYTNFSAKINLNNMSIEEGTGVSITGSTVTISKAGIYYFAGTAEEGNIIVNADNQEVVLVLDNVNITCTTTSVINVLDAKKVTINIPNGTTSTLTDGSEYTVFTEDDEPNATVFSKDDLSIDGEGTLVINANYQDAIASKDGLKIINTTLKITAEDDGIRGKDYVAIKDATITVKSKGKSIKATEETDTSLGYIVIDGGTFNIESNDDALHSNNNIIINNGTFSISADDDGIHADSSIYINGGTINIIKSYEGIEANYIEINDGDISVVSSDDGINVNGGTDTMGMRGQDAFKTISEDGSNDNRMLVINGGNITVESNGDGLDSNGSVKIAGGTTIVGGSANGGNSALDYDKSFIITGGTVIAYGPTGMWQNPSNSSTQYSIAYAVVGKADDKIELKDTSGSVVASFTAKRAYGMVCISAQALKQGETYTLYVNNDEVATQELTSIVTSNGSSQGQFGGGFQGQMKNGEMPNFQMSNGEEMASGDNMQIPTRDGQKPQNMKNFERPQGPTDGEISGSFKGQTKRDGKRQEMMKNNETTQNDNNSI